MAQLVEHILGKDEVVSSTLTSSSKKFDLFRQVEFFYDARSAVHIITRLRAFSYAMMICNTLC